MECFFVSDLHGIKHRYDMLFEQVLLEKPQALFIGGDIFPNFSRARSEYDDFVYDFLVPYFQNLKDKLKSEYPEVFLILGNDDPKLEEENVVSAGSGGLWRYIHKSKAQLGEFTVFGYAFVPPTPFLYKDWERYDVSRYVDPGCVHPTEGKRTDNEDIEYVTIEKELKELVGDVELDKSVFLFHSPPYKSYLDRAALDGMTYEDVPLDVHVGSIAIQRFIQEKQPLLTLHGHIHESSRITGHWKEQSRETWMFSAAYEFPKLAIVKFNLKILDDAKRELY